MSYTAISVSVTYDTGPETWDSHGKTKEKGKKKCDIDIDKKYNSSKYTDSKKMALNLVDIICGSVSNLLDR